MEYLKNLNLWKDSDNYLYNSDSDKDPELCDVHKIQLTCIYNNHDKKYDARCPVCHQNYSLRKSGNYGY